MTKGGAVDVDRPGCECSVHVEGISIIHLSDLGKSWTSSILVLVGVSWTWLFLRCLNYQHSRSSILPLSALFVRVTRVGH